MEISQCTVQQFVANEEAYLRRLENEEVWNQVPLLNPNEVHHFRDGALIRFRGMIQDMHGPEYYLEKFEVLNQKTKEKLLKNGKYSDFSECAESESIEENSKNNVTSERQKYVVISIPGMNQWVVDHEFEKFGIKNEERPSSSQGFVKTKRSIEEIMDCEENNQANEPENGQKKSPNKAENSEGNKTSLIVSQDHILNFPLPDSKGKVCHIRIYTNSEHLKLNDTIELVGFLSVNPFKESMYESDEFENKMEVQTHYPPSSLVPSIHVVSFKTLKHNNPLVNEASIEANKQKLANIKKELSILLSQLLMGDTLAAEYVICHLISEVYLRHDFMPLGKFSLNISNVPKVDDHDFVLEFYKFFEMLLPKSYYLPMSLENMNTMMFTPKKDYECNRLTSGVLQLSPNTHFVLDETKLSEGKLEAHGVNNVKVLAQTIKTQKIAYDFGYYPIEYECDIPFLVFSEGKSMLPSDVHIPLKPDETCLRTYPEILVAARHFLKPELLNDIRCYLTQARLVKYELSNEVQDLVQKEFVEMRQNEKITGDDLHLLLVLARLMCISEGQNTLNTECWKKACEMEKLRKERLKK